MSLGPSSMQSDSDNSHPGEVTGSQSKASTALALDTQGHVHSDVLFNKYRDMYINQLIKQMSGLKEKFEILDKSLDNSVAISKGFLNASNVWNIFFNSNDIIDGNRDVDEELDDGEFEEQEVVNKVVGQERQEADHDNNKNNDKQNAESDKPVQVSPE
ncbi:unnamed protein product [[Candida] boidinii]|nr:hypothetical protein BVG19_g47 [[Candida] boidinii]OWB53399.1 hypothetical protein B5S27_g4995 [[Candida] boidinii]OWB85732.1 hypothetical protein B5S33_g4403 [[Candida] boidinii]GMF41493.1 unnamed protein product [[Candida] boidinii]